MQFINIVVHSVEDIKVRVTLQVEFAKLGLDEYLEELKSQKSDKLNEQIAAYTDNDFVYLLDEAKTNHSARMSGLQLHLA